MFCLSFQADARIVLYVSMEFVPLLERLGCRGLVALHSVLPFSVTTLADYLTHHCTLISRYLIFLLVEEDDVKSESSIFLNV
jgi:hypothetical protein